MVITTATIISTHTLALECNNAITEGDLRECAMRNLKKSEKKLEILYKKLMSKGDTKYKTLVKKSEISWIKFKENECEVQAYPTNGGSMQPTIRLMCLQDKTEKRIIELKDLVNCKEGEVTCLL